MCLALSDLHEHKFRHCFQDTLNPLCEYGKDIESTMYFSLHCTNFLIPRETFQKIRNIDASILSQTETQLTQLLLYDNQNYHSSIKRLIISTIEYLISTEWFKCSLFVKKPGFKTRFSWWLLYLCNFIFFFFSGMLINTVPDDCPMYIGFNLF